MTEPRAAFLETLFHHRWGAPILAELQRSSGAKFVTLVHRLGAPKDSVQATLAALIESGWVARNLGHGHPLRPEYILTPSGTRIARACARLVDALHERALEEIGLKKWSMPVVFALRQGPHRFSALKAQLASVSSRALTLALKDLVESELVERTVSDSFPPAVLYGLTPKARALRVCLERL